MTDQTTEYPAEQPVESPAEPTAETPTRRAAAPSRGVLNDSRLTHAGSAAAAFRPPLPRHLREGQAERFDDDAPGPAEFASMLDAAIAGAVADGRFVPVFRLRHRMLGLQVWSEETPASETTVAAALDRRLTGLDLGLVLHRISSTELLAFTETVDRNEARRVAGGVLAAVTGVFQAEAGSSGTFAVSPRLGMAVAGADLPTAGRAIEAADQTVRQTDHSSPYLVFNEYIRRRSERERRIEAEIPRALEDGRLTAGYRARFSAHDCRLVSLEAYPRWDDDAPPPQAEHDDVGTAAADRATQADPPERRITVAELLRLADRTGHLFEIGEVVRTAAGADAVAWLDEGLLADRRIWFNVAPAELCHPQFLLSLIEFNDQHPEINFGVELKDSPILDEPICAGPFDLLRAAGFALALDSVTTASLSFARLQNLPLTSIHLGRDLVHALPISSSGGELVSLICAAAHERGITVNASEVETEEEMVLAGSYGVDVLQGPALGGSMNRTQAWHMLRFGQGPDRRVSDRID